MSYNINSEGNRKPKNCIEEYSVFAYFFWKTDYDQVVVKFEKAGS